MEGGDGGKRVARVEKCLAGGDRGGKGGKVGNIVLLII